MSDASMKEEKKGIAIGVICPEGFEEPMRSALKRFPSFEPVLLAYRNEEEAHAIAKRLMEEAEVLFFSGPLPYMQAEKQLKFTVPAHYLHLTGTGLYRALFCLERQSGLQALSVDTLTNSMVTRAFKELGVEQGSIFTYDGPGVFSRDDLVSFHRRLHEQGSSMAALTGFRSVAQELTKLGIPNEWVVPTEQDIIVGLERALLSTESRKNKESQIVLGIIAVDDSVRLFDKIGSEHEVQRLKLDIHRMVLGYAESLDGHLTDLGGDEYLFITTRGVFERETGGYKYIPLAREAERSFGLSLSVGVGFGLSANEAGTHARQALRQAREAGGNISYIVREDGGVIGPLEMSEPLEYNLALLDADFIKKAEQSGMTLTYLSKLSARVSRKGQTDYTAQELAAILGVTMRTVHRLLLQWIDAGLVQSVGERKSQTKGRPKQIFRLVFMGGDLGAK
ncbi:hypothetical protein O9H85_32025 [Paenibacillus filicis]|uniref:GGDEF domain-containing protein n=1 Tax=Paenibacillus gyeongsangnamensis TaxID=3388067 RepID=A0ABT4QJN1_9BACL|nr:hypothetical protein [Paenibacillus filicis]MCZ8516906.1 hypothetical protein [Paenibacillus filicis]